MSWYVREGLAEGYQLDYDSEKHDRRWERAKACVDHSLRSEFHLHVNDSLQPFKCRLAQEWYDCALLRSILILFLTVDFIFVK